jgi:hypothetical protein
LRGLLYSAIINLEGKKLEEKILLEDMKKIGMEIVGFAIPIGFIKAVVDFFNNQFLFNKTPELIENAEFMSTYLNDYKVLLVQWSDLIVALTDQLIKRQ